MNGVSRGHLTGIRVPDYDGVSNNHGLTTVLEVDDSGLLQPITDVTSNDVICNGGINPYHQPISTTVIPVPGGAQVTAEWHHSQYTCLRHI